jgi:hypothetical protein
MEVSQASGVAGIRLTRAEGNRGGDLDITALSFPTPNAGEQSIGFGSKAREDRNSVDPTTCTVCRIPAGRYTLYALTQGGPAEIRLTFGGLSGETVLSALQPVAASFSTNDSVTGASTDAGGYAGVGAEARLELPETVIQLDYFDAQDRASAPGVPAGGVGNYGFCGYPGGRLPAEGVLPGCAGGTIGAPTFVGVSVTGGFGFSHIGLLTGATPGPYAVGAYGTHAGLPFKNAASTLITFPDVA